MWNVEAEKNTPISGDPQRYRQSHAGALTSLLAHPISHTSSHQSRLSSDTISLESTNPRLVGDPHFDKVTTPSWGQTVQANLSCLVPEMRSERARFLLVNMSPQRPPSRLKNIGGSASLDESRVDTPFSYVREPDTLSTCDVSGGRLPTEESSKQ